MPRRSPLSLQELATWDNLSLAFERASRGRRRQTDVLDFAKDLDASLTELGAAILNENVVVGRFRTFRIHDPKPRVIHAPVFAERVLHHAVMNKVGPVLDRSLVDDTYACRVGKGALAAVHRAQAHLRRHPFYVKVDMRQYFASIAHERLKAQLERRFKNRGLLRLLARIVDSYTSTTAPINRGLPIGALTSQHLQMCTSRRSIVSCSSTVRPAPWFGIWTTLQRGAPIGPPPRRYSPISRFSLARRSI